MNSRSLLPQRPLSTHVYEQEKIYRKKVSLTVPRVFVTIVRCWKFHKKREPEWLPTRCAVASLRFFSRTHAQCPQFRDSHSPDLGDRDRSLKPPASVASLPPRKKLIRNLFVGEFGILIVSKSFELLA